MKFKMLFSAATLALAAACATPATGPEAQSRFDTFDVASSAVEFSSYESVYVAPVAASEELRSRIGYRPRGTSDDKRPLDEDDLAEKSANLAEDIRSALAGQVDLVDAGGADILTIAVELTALESNRPTQADLAAEPGLSIQSVYAGRAGVSITFSEGDTVLAIATDGDTPFLDDTLQPAPLWSTVDRYFDRLARKLSDLLS